MGYLLCEVDVRALPGELLLSESQEGAGIVFRDGDRLVGFELVAAEAGARLDRAAIARAAGTSVAHQVLAGRVERDLGATSDDLDEPGEPRPPTPTLSIAICTKDRADRLARLLESLEAARSASPFPRLEILVIDNDSKGDDTRLTAQGRDGVHYRLEPKPGLNFARNRALQAATGDLIAYLDDDVVVDRQWLTGLHDAWHSCPDAGGFTGLVLPLRLDTEAQLRFEQRGGFGRGFSRRELGGASSTKDLWPVGAGEVGAGCNMAFRRELLIELGGFDDALDTGAPLPGGGDLDIFYRVLRSGHRMVYAADYAVYHEHRESIRQLRHQYWTWGLGFVAFLAKSRRADPSSTGKHRAMARWWWRDRARHVVRALGGADWVELRFALAELGGGLVGMLGGYDRSLRRVAKIRKAAG